MIGLTVRLEGVGPNGDGAFTEEAAKANRIIHLGNDAAPMILAGLKNGMTSGRTSVALGITLPDGESVIAELSLRLILAAADALRARFGDE